MSKIAVVTGGAGGIGQAVAERFGKDEYKLVLIDLDDQAGQQLAGEWRRRGGSSVGRDSSLQGNICCPQSRR